MLRQKNMRDQGGAATLTSAIFLPDILLPTHSFSQSKIQNHSHSALRTQNDQRVANLLKSFSRHAKITFGRIA